MTEIEESCQENKNERFDGPVTLRQHVYVSQKKMVLFTNSSDIRVNSDPCYDPHFNSYRGVIALIVAEVSALIPDLIFAL